MRKKNDKVQAGKLPLPLSRSSDELDERILRAAREGAPASKSQGQPWWIGGAATASVLVVAVTISWTDPPPVGTTEEPAAVGASMLAKKMQSQQSEIHEMGASIGTSDQAAARPEVTRAQISDESLSTDILSDYAAAPTMRVRELELRKSIEPAVELSSPITPHTLSQKIQLLLELTRQGQNEKAYRDYDALKKSCPECDLPERLEEAIAKYILRE